MDIILLYYKEILGVLSIGLMIPQVYVYLRSVFSGETKPHVYTKIIWFILTAIAFLVQVQHGGGPGAWILGFTCLNQLIILILCVKYGTSDITRFDTLLLIFSLICIPLYLGVEDKFYALIFVMFIDILGYLPTYRKSYNNPYTENILAWSIGTIKYIVAIFALAELSFYTLAYPVFLIVSNSILLLILVYRRKVVSNS